LRATIARREATIERREATIARREGTIQRLREEVAAANLAAAQAERAAATAKEQWSGFAQALHRDYQLKQAAMLETLRAKDPSAARTLGPQWDLTNFPGLPRW
jgi:hypothetical protein